MLKIFKNLMKHNFIRNFKHCEHLMIFNIYFNINILKRFKNIKNIIYIKLGGKKTTRLSHF